MSATADYQDMVNHDNQLQITAKERPRNVSNCRSHKSIRKSLLLLLAYTILFASQMSAQQAQPPSSPPTLQLPAITLPSPFPAPLTNGNTSRASETVGTNAAGADFWTESGGNLFTTNTGNVGVGTTSPGYKLDVAGTGRFQTLGVNGTGYMRSLTVESSPTSGLMHINLDNNVNPGLLFQVRDPNGYYPSIHFAKEDGGTIGTIFGYKYQGLFLQSGPGQGIVFRPAGSDTNSVVLNASGNFGIGFGWWMAPAAKLHVNGNTRLGGDVIVDGNIAAKYQDVAEWVESRQELTAATVVVLDAERINQVLASSTAYDTRVAGVISDKPGLLLSTLR